MYPLEVIKLMKDRGVRSLAHVTINGRHEYYQTITDLEALPDKTKVEILSVEVQSLDSVRMKHPPRNAAYKGRV